MDPKTTLKNGWFWSRFWATLDEQKVAFYLDGKAFGVNLSDIRTGSALVFKSIVEERGYAWDKRQRLW